MEGNPNAAVRTQLPAYYYSVMYATTVNKVGGDIPGSSEWPGIASDWATWAT